MNTKAMPPCLLFQKDLRLHYQRFPIKYRTALAKRSRSQAPRTSILPFSERHIPIYIQLILQHFRKEGPQLKRAERELLPTYAAHAYNSLRVPVADFQGNVQHVRRIVSGQWMNRHRNDWAWIQLRDNEGAPGALDGRWYDPHSSRCRIPYTMENRSDLKGTYHCEQGNLKT